VVTGAEPCPTIGRRLFRSVFCSIAARNLIDIDVASTHTASVDI